MSSYVHGSVVVTYNHTDRFHTISVATFLLGGVDKTVLDISFTFEIIAFINDDLIVLAFDIEGDDLVFFFDILAGFNGVIDDVGKEVIELT